MVKIFPHAPSQIKYVIIVLVLVASTLYTDYITGQQTNVIIFFISCVVYPVVIAGIASRTEGENLDEMLGFRGDLIYIISMVLISGGMIGLIFLFIIEPIASIYVGTEMYKAITVFYMPLSSQQFWFIAVTPLYSLIFYGAVSVGEEILKFFSFSVISNWLYEKINRGKWPVIIFGFILSLLGWLSLHFISWNGLPIEGIIMGIALSVLFIIPYMFSEPIISSEKGFQIDKFSIYSSIAGHLFYDFYLSLMADGFLTLELTNLLQIGSVVILSIGGILLIFKYYQTGRGLLFSETLR